MSFYDEWLAEYMPKLGARALAFKAITDELDKLYRPVTIMETGCVRSLGNWAGDGQSTIVWDAFITYKGGSVWSVDINQDAVDLANESTSSQTFVKRSDSVAFLTYMAVASGFHVDLLYLDSFDIDWSNPTPSQEHHERELQAALPMLKRGTVVAVDDNLPHAGKGYLVGRYAEAHGWATLADDYVRAWIVN